MFLPSSFSSLVSGCPKPASSSHLQHRLSQATEWQNESLVLTDKIQTILQLWDCLIFIVSQRKPKVKEFTYLVYLFLSEGGGQGEMDRQIRAMPSVVVPAVKVKRELLIYLLIYIPVVTYGPMGCDTKNEMGDRSSGNVSFQGWALT